MMSFSIARQPRIRSVRKLRPALEGCESRLLMSGATISGTTFQDISGDGTFTDVSRMPNVTIDLTRTGSSTVLEKLTTNSSGNFSFNNLAPGNYTVQQVLPSGYIPTGAWYGYSDTVSGNDTEVAKDFEDYKLTPPPTIDHLAYTVTTPAGKSSTVSSLSGNVHQGDTVKATFNLETPAQMTLVAYSAPNGDFDTSNLQKQVIFSEASTKTGTGSESLTVTVPDGYFQIDFVAGLAIAHLETNTNVSYHAQDRFIDGANGGTQVAPKPAAVVPVDVTTTPVIIAPSVAPTVAILAADPDVASPSDSQARKH
jgi:SdrD B-like domain